MSSISRVCVHAKPGPKNPDYAEWQTAKLVVLTTATSEEAAITSARVLLEERHWEVLRIDLCDRLIEERVRDQGGKLWALYQEARSSGRSMKILPDHFGAGPDGIDAIRPPRVSEGFMDEVVRDAGGRRLNADGSARIADYLIEDWIFELKDLQEEGLLQPARQKKLANLFQRHRSLDQPTILDPALLDDGERRSFFDILSTPIQNQVKSASKQIRSTKGHLNNPSLHGGVIYINSGYGSFPHDQFGPLVERYASKDTTQVEAILAISTWSVTNGFDSYIYFNAYPEGPSDPVVQRLKEAFAARFEQAMTKLVRGQLQEDETLSDPLKPVAFQVEGLDFAWMPPSVPATWQ
jgi:hypothetical protein